MESQKTQNCPIYPGEKEQNWRHNPFKFQIMLQSYKNQSEWHWHKSRPMDQGHRIESPEINPHTYRQLTNEARIHNGEKTVSSGTGAGKTGQLYVKGRK